MFVCALKKKTNQLLAQFLQLSSPNTYLNVWVGIADQEETLQWKVKEPIPGRFTIAVDVAQC